MDEYVEDTKGVEDTVSSTGEISSTLNDQICAQNDSVDDVEDVEDSLEMPLLPSLYSLEKPEKPEKCPNCNEMIEPYNKNTHPACCKREAKGTNQVLYCRQRSIFLQCVPSVPSVPN